MLNRLQKEELVKEFHEKLARVGITVVVDYKGLSVAEINELRQKCKDSGIEFRVLKNTLLKIAAKGTDAEKITDYFVGPNAVALGYDDPVPVAKVLCEFAGKNDKLKIKCGVMGGQVLDPDGLKRLSQLPSREVLLAQLLSVMVAVPTSLVRALQNVPERLVYALNAIKEEKEKEAA